MLVERSSQQFACYAVASMDKKDDTKEILETVIFIRDKVVSIENEVAEVKRDVREVQIASTTNSTSARRLRCG